MDNRRFFLWTALAAILIMLWTSWEQEYGPKEPLQPIAETQVDHTLPAAPSVPTAESDKQTSATPTPEAKVAELKSGQKIRVLTDLLEVELDTYGGDIRSALLRTYPVALHKTDEPFQLLNDNSKTLYVAQSGLIGKGNAYPNHKTLYRASNTRYELKQGEKELLVTLTWRAPDGVTYDKLFKFKRNSYNVYRRRNKPACFVYRRIPVEPFTRRTKNTKRFPTRIWKSMTLPARPPADGRQSCNIISLSPGWTNPRKPANCTPVTSATIIT